MKYLEKYTGEKTYMFPNSAIATPEAVLLQFPAALTFAHIVETDGEVLFAMQNLSAMRQIYDVATEATESEAIVAIQEAVNAPTPEPVPSAEERTAAALEFQSMMML